MRAEQLGVARADAADMVDQRAALLLHALEQDPALVGQELLGRVEDLQQAGARAQGAELAEPLAQPLERQQEVGEQHQARMARQRRQRRLGGALGGGSGPGSG